MKLSLAWLCDHITELYRLPHADKLNPEFVKRVTKLLGEHTTEIESVAPVRLDINRFTLGQLKEQTADAGTLVSAELKKQFALPFRAGARIGGFYLLVQDQNNYRYATLADVHSDKEGLVAELSINEAETAGSWKQGVETLDYIITLDNKAITHRPDLWGHRGFAREVAALLSMHLRPEDELVAALPIRHYAGRVERSPEMPYALSIDGQFCKRLAALALTQVTIQPSNFFMAYRLARVDSRPYNAVVDSTNYVMFDLGQPMHAFDGACLAGNTLTVRMAMAGETLTVLDGQTLSLAADDGVIADAQRARALAGVMGGKDSGVTLATTTLLVESANFNPDAIRKTAMRYRKRTEASARFEKGQDPNQNTTAVLRFMRLMDDLGVPYKVTGGIASLGQLAVEQGIEISHEFIVDRIGTAVPSSSIVTHLSRLGFGVVTRQVSDKLMYAVSVPTFRGTDVTIKEAVVEEAVRLIGYNNITRQLPTRLTRPLDHSKVLKTRAIKQHAAFAWHAHEVSNYAFYDETWLRALSCEPQDTVRVKNPVSEHWSRLATSLVPHLLKNVAHNVPEYEQVNLFEVNKVWRLEGDQIHENKQLSALFFSYKKPYDFYVGKAQVQSLFDLLALLVIWQKPTTPLAPWYLPEKTAELVVDGVVIGAAGMVSPRMLHDVAEGEAFVVELSMDFLLNYVAPVHRYEAVSKYQQVSFDMSMLVPRTVTVDVLKSALATVDARIIDVALRDFFENPAWPDQRSITLRYTMVDQEKTLSKDDIDNVWKAAVQAVVAHGAQLR